ncbi:hypothetical protein WA158_002698 [Blastocystis sp. Blastoise]
MIEIDWMNSSSLSDKDMHIYGDTNKDNEIPIPSIHHNLETNVSSLSLCLNSDIYQVQIRKLDSLFTTIPNMTVSTLHMSIEPTYSETYYAYIWTFNLRYLRISMSSYIQTRQNMSSNPSFSLSSFYSISNTTKDIIINTTKDTIINTTKDTIINTTKDTIIPTLTSPINIYSTPSIPNDFYNYTVTFFYNSTFSFFTSFLIEYPFFSVSSYTSLYLNNHLLTPTSSMDSSNHLITYYTGSITKYFLVFPQSNILSYMTNTTSLLYESLLQIYVVSFTNYVQSLSSYHSLPSIYTTIDTCPEEGQWPSTSRGDTAIIPCPSQYYIGKQSRLCRNTDPVSWGSIIDTCIMQVPRLYYNSSIINIIYSTPMAPLIPQCIGICMTWSIEPSLPESLSFDTNTGIITGTPSIPTYSEIHVIVSSNLHNSGSIAISISITAPYCNSEDDWPTTFVDTTVTLPCTDTSKQGKRTRQCKNTYPPMWNTIIDKCTYRPPIVSYKFSSLVFYKDEICVDLTPLTHYYITSWAVSPSLPNGLSLNEKTGHLFGQSKVTISASLFTITASNPDVSTSVSITITILQYTCSAEGEWPRTEVNSVATLLCDGVPYAPQVRVCTLKGSQGVWKDVDISLCKTSNPNEIPSEGYNYLYIPVVFVNIQPSDFSSFVLYKIHTIMKEQLTQYGYNAVFSILSIDESNFYSNESDSILFMHSQSKSYYEKLTSMIHLYIPFLTNNSTNEKNPDLIDLDDNTTSLIFGSSVLFRFYIQESFTQGISTLLLQYINSLFITDIHTHLPELSITSIYALRKDIVIKRRLSTTTILTILILCVLLVLFFLLLLGVYMTCHPCDTNCCLGKNASRRKHLTVLKEQSQTDIV